MATVGIDAVAGWLLKRGFSEGDILRMARDGDLPPPRPGEGAPKWEKRLIDRWDQAKTTVERACLSGFYSHGTSRGMLGEKCFAVRQPFWTPNRSGSDVCEARDTSPHWSPGGGPAFPARRDASQGQTAKSISGLAVCFFDPNRPGTEFTWSGGDGWKVQERIAPTALDTTDFSDVVALFNHDQNNILGRNTSATLRLTKTRQGLAYNVDLGDGVISRHVFSLVKRGDVSGSSFAFTIGKDSWSENVKTKTAIREIKSISRIFDVGPVCWPAYTSTSAQAGGKDARQARIGREIEDALRDMRRHG